MLQWEPSVLSWASGDVSHKSMAASEAIIEMQSRKGELINSFSTRIYYVPNVCPHCARHQRNSGQQEDLVSWSLHYNERDEALTRSQINTIIMKWIMGINRVKEGYSEDVTFKWVEGWQWVRPCKSWGKGLPVGQGQGKYKGSELGERLAGLGVRVMLRIRNKPSEDSRE